jgi:hypothetical protein
MKMLLSLMDTIGAHKLKIEIDQGKISITAFHCLPTDCIAQTVKADCEEVERMWCEDESWFLDSFKSFREAVIKHQRKK